MSNPTPVLNPATTSTSHFRYSFFRSIAAAGQDWAAAAPAHDLFLQRPYLEILEQNPPRGMRFAYSIFYKNEQPVGVAYFQIKYFKGDDNIRDLNQTSEKDPCFFTALGNWFKKKVAQQVAADILILGNMLLTGEHGYHFDFQEISQQQAMRLLEEASVKLLKEMERDGVKMPVILVKDLVPQNRLTQGNFWQEKNFVEFEIQPNMVMNLEWDNFEGYLKAMSTKYRTRAKRAFKKLDGIEKRELSFAEMCNNLPKIYHLYEEIARNAGFNMVDLNENYLTSLRRDLPEFRAFGYFLEGNLVAFFTTIRNGSELEAHFLGYEKSLNHDYQIYQNILYEIARMGIEMEGVEQIVFARTALEIKSTVGAAPQDLYCYLRHQNSFANKFAGSILDYLKPVEAWQQRHPFKEE